MNSDDDQSSVSSDHSRSQSIRGSIQRRLRSFSSSADRSRYSFIDGTKTVVKNVLRRRTSSEIREVQEEPKDDRVSLDASEIMDTTINFEFPPFVSEKKLEFPLERKFSLASGPPPPSYPPPELPKSYYVDVFACDDDRWDTSYPDSGYEPLEETKASMTTPLYDRDSFDSGSDLQPSYEYLTDDEFGKKFEAVANDSLSDSLSALGFETANHQSENKIASDSLFDSSETSSSGRSLEVRSFEGDSNNRPSYENWNLPTTRREEEVASPAPPPLASTPLQSLIIEFDPILFNPISSEADLPLDDLSFLAASESNRSAGEDSGSGGVGSVDLGVPKNSLFSRESVVTNDEYSMNSRRTYTVSDERLHEFAYKGKRKSSMKGPSSIAGWSMTMKKAVEKVVRPRRVSSPKETTSTTTAASLSAAEMYVKPGICSIQEASLHNGYLYKSTGDKSSNFVKRWCQLSESKLNYSVDRDTPKEFIDLNCVMSVSLVKDQKQSCDGVELYCFEVTTSATRNPKHLFAATCTSERCFWMQKMVDNLTTFFPALLSSDYTKMGWCWLKEGINGAWMSCWLLLQKRTLTIAHKSTDSSKLLKVDLRQARQVYSQSSTDALLFSGQQEQEIVMDIDKEPTQSLYLIMGSTCETNEWLRVLRVAATDNGISLDDQQLTKEKVPVIVEKCIDFIFRHGSMAEGIYRRSGSNSNVTKLLSLFRQDSWSIHLKHGEYGEHDVANVLKRFFRDLPEPLFTVHQHKRLCNAPERGKKIELVKSDASSSQLGDSLTENESIYALLEKARIQCSEEDKLSLYRNLLEQLETINYVTVRKLIGHLHSIHGQHEKNLMPVDNLAAIWGPTLMPHENNESWSKRECEVIRDLILYYPILFHVDKKVLEREKQMLDYLERFNDSTTFAPQSHKQSDGLIVFIYLNSKESGETVGVKLDPSKCCDSVYEECATKMQTQPHLLCLQDVVCGEALKRTLHHKERIWNSVTRWGYWDEEDRKDCYLLLTDNKSLREVMPLAKPPATICSELKYADRKTKSFKNHLFEVSEGKLYYYKDKKSSIRAKEWNIDDIVWYDGFEPKRNPHSRWAITFIDIREEQKRSKERPFFGYTIAGSQKEEHLRWKAALLLAKYSADDLLPPVTLLK